MKHIIVFIDHSAGEIRKASYEAVSEAYRIGEKTNQAVCGVIINYENTDKTDVFSDLHRYGLQKIIAVNARGLSTSSGESFSSSKAYAEIIEKYIHEQEVELVLLPATSLGKSIAPLLAGKINARVANDCTALNVVDGTIHITRPIYAGKIIAEVAIETDIKIATLRPNIFNAKKVALPEELEIIDEDYQVSELKAVVKEVLTGDTGEVSLTEADVIVAGGRGMKGTDNFTLLKELADLFGGAVGASRSAVDEGWIDHSHQVGQTGKVVAPKLYIACGISGAVQHLAGMSSSKCIVAINKNPDAPIFHFADYGIVADLFDVVPALTEEIKKIKS